MRTKPRLSPRPASAISRTSGLGAWRNFGLVSVLDRLGYTDTRGQWPAWSLWEEFPLRSALFSTFTAPLNRGHGSRFFFSFRGVWQDGHGHKERHQEPCISDFLFTVGATHHDLEFSINTASRDNPVLTHHPPQSHSKQHAVLIVSLSSPSMTTVTKALPSPPLPGSLRPRPDVSRDTPVCSSLARSFVPSHP